MPAQEGCRCEPALRPRRPTGRRGRPPTMRRLARVAREVSRANASTSRAMPLTSCSRPTLIRAEGHRGHAADPDGVVQVIHDRSLAPVAMVFRSAIGAARCRRPRKRRCGGEGRRRDVDPHKPLSCRTCRRGTGPARYVAARRSTSWARYHSAHGHRRREQATLELPGRSAIAMDPCGSGASVKTKGMRSSRATTTAPGCPDRPCASG